MNADARQTEFCTYLSAILLGGLLLNTFWGRASGEGRPLVAANFWAHAAGRQCFALTAKAPQ